MSDRRFLLMNTQRLLMLTDKQHRALLDVQLEKSGIHRSQFHMLHHISHHLAGITQEELAAELEISAAATTVSLEKLEKMHMVKRDTRHPGSRKKTVEITETGKKVLENMESVCDAMDVKMFMGLSDTEIETLRGLLERVYENVSGEAEERRAERKPEE